MNKKGFTLIELLAVIVILAIIALIAVPIVLNIIDESKENATLRSAEMYLDAVELSIADRVMHHGAINDGLYPIMSDGNICLENYDDKTGECKDKDENPDNNVLEVEINREGPTSGSIYIENGEIFKGIDANKKTYLVISEKTIEPIEENGEVKFGIADTNNGNGESTGPTLASCEFKEGTEKAIGAKYECDFGDGKRKFYILDIGINPVNPNLKEDEVALILEGNYDETTQAWCASGSDNSCKADGLTSKLDDIAEAWKELEREQIVLPSGEQIMVADGRSENAYTTDPILTNTWLYNWPDNADYGSSAPYGYWTSSPRADDSSLAWRVGYSGRVSRGHVGSDGGFGVRPVVNLKI